jgi:two-component system chemotaxis sensor kinase CheA
MSADTVPHTFLAESRELLQDMERALLALERAPRDSEAIHAVFRAVHTIKGSSGMFGLDAIVAFTHALETVMVEVRDGAVPVDDVLLALLLACADHLLGMVDAIEAPDRDARMAQLEDAGVELLTQLACFGAQEGGDHPAAAAGADWHISLRLARDVLRHGLDPLSLLRYLAKVGQVAGVAVIDDALPAAADMDPEACYLGLEIRLRTTAQREDIESAFEFVREGGTVLLLPPGATPADCLDHIARLPEDRERLLEALFACGTLTREQLLQAQPREDDVIDADAASPLALPASASRSLRVDAGKLDDLIDLVGELVIASAGVGLRAAAADNLDLREATTQLGRLVEQVRDGALALRMVPIGETFERFHRVVRDLGHSLGKEVDLAVRGGDTELDKSMVEKLNDPLVHLVRNALDHGIEAPALRQARGKPARGRITLNAYHETGSIVIEVEDDGGGLDRERILARAVEAGLAQADHDIADRELYQLVMEPGFSTAAAVTNVSGRGIGMDVVKRNVEALHGTVAIQSRPGEGTVMALRVPLTLAIIDGFLVGLGRSSYVVPLEMVVECLELGGEERSRVRERGYVNLRGEVLPLLRLRDLFEVEGAPGKRENIVVVQCGEQRAGFVVDALLGEFQTVIKPLGRLFERLAGISGSTILGTGEVALILDVQALVQRAVDAEARRTALATANKHHLGGVGTC